MKSKDNLPLVSIAIPVLNGGEYFEMCLKSVQNQTYPNWECVINNNHSTDNTLEIAKRFASEDSRFKVFDNEEFLIMVDNWNKACSRIHPDTVYLKVLGADDWIFPESIEKMVKLMEKHPEVGVCSSYRIVDRQVEGFGMNLWDGEVYDGKDMLYKQLTRQRDITGSNTTFLLSMEHLKKLPRFPMVFDNTAYHQDTELVYEMMNISKVGFIFQILSYTRRHEEAHTLTEGIRFRTLHQLNEKVLWMYKGDDTELNRRYRDQRYEYAAFMLWRKLRFDRKAINWHRNYIVRKFTFWEYLVGAFTRNKLSQFFLRIIRKITSRPDRS